MKGLMLATIVAMTGCAHKPAETPLLSAGRHDGASAMIGADERSAVAAEDAADWAKLQTVLNVAGLAGLAVTVYFTGMTLRVSRRQFSLVQRPSIAIYQVRVSVEANMPLKGEFWISNEGGSTAYLDVASSTSTAAFFHIGTTLPPRHPINDDGNGSKNPYRYIEAPHQLITAIEPGAGHWWSVTDSAVRPNDFESVQRGERFIWLMGRLRFYLDEKYKGPIRDILFIKQFDPVSRRFFDVGDEDYVLTGWPQMRDKLPRAGKLAKTFNERVIASST